MMDIDTFGYFLISLHQLSLRINPGQPQNNQLFGHFQSIALKKVTSTREQVEKYCNWRKEAFLCL